MLGFYLNELPEDKAELVASWAEDDSGNEDFYKTDSIKDAIQHFDLYIKDGTFHITTPESIAMNGLLLSKEEVATFRTTLNSLLAEMPNSEALQNVILFPTWAPNTHYNAGDRIRYDNTLYRVTQSHISQPDWLPTIVTSLFTPIILETE